MKTVPTPTLGLLDVLLEEIAESRGFLGRWETQYDLDELPENEPARQRIFDITQGYNEDYRKALYLSEYEDMIAMVHKYRDINREANQKIISDELFNTCLLTV